MPLSLDQDLAEVAHDKRVLQARIYRAPRKFSTVPPSFSLLIQDKCRAIHWKCELYELTCVSEGSPGKKVSLLLVLSAPALRINYLTFLSSFSSLLRGLEDFNFWRWQQQQKLTTSPSALSAHTLLVLSPFQGQPPEVLLLPPDRVRKANPDGLGRGAHGRPGTPLPLGHAGKRQHSGPGGVLVPRGWDRHARQGTLPR